MLVFSLDIVLRLEAIIDVTFQTPMHVLQRRWRYHKCKYAHTLCWVRQGGFALERIHAQVKSVVMASAPHVKEVVLLHRHRPSMLSTLFYLIISLKWTEKVDNLLAYV